MQPRLFLTLVTASTFLLADVAAASPDDGTTVEDSTRETVTVTTTETSESETSQTSESSESVPVAYGEAPQDPVDLYAPQPQPQPAQPPVYQPQKRRGLGLMISGWSLFAASYGITALAGAAVIDSCDSDDTYDCRKLGGSLMIPVLGPLLATSEVDSMTGRVGLVVFPGLAQVAGLSMGIAGTVLFARSRRRYATALNSDGLRITRRAKNLRVSNTASPFGGGVRLTYRF